MMSSRASDISVRDFWPLAMLRVYTGVFFLKYGWGKITNDKFADGVVGFLNSRENMFGFYQGFAESVVIPNKGLFAFLVGWGELALGLALIVGLATRYAAWAGVFMVVNFWFAKGQGFLDAQNHDTIWMMILIALAILPAGHVIGLDARLSERFRFLR